MNYFNKHNYVIKGAKLNYQNHIFDGHGFMEWNPDYGFDLKLFADSDTYKSPKSEKYGGSKIIKKNERSNIHLFLDFYRKAIIPSAYLPNRLTFGIDSTLQFRSHRLVLLQELFYPDKDYWTGNALYRISEGMHKFPETIKKSETLNETFIISRGTKHHGVSFQNEVMEIKGWKTNEEYFNVLFKLSKNHYSKKFALNFPCGLQSALTFILGENVQRLKTTVDSTNISVLNIFKKFDVNRLRTYQTLKTFDKFTGELLGKLALFFTEGYLDHEQHVESYVSRLILSQLIEAENQKSYAAQELLTATILEAALRTIFNIPFHSQGKSLSVQNELKGKFKKKYSLNNDWDTVLDKVIEAQKKLRDRNAHPDWLIKDDSIYSDDRISDTYLDLRIMIKFYQQMILLMAGVEDVEPKLPKKI